MIGRLRNYTVNTTGGMPFLPLGILFAVFFFDEWDTQGFNTLAPNIKHAFHLTDKAFGIIVIVNLSIILLGAIPPPPDASRTAYSRRRYGVVVSRWLTPNVICPPPASAGAVDGSHFRSPGGAWRGLRPWL